MQKDLELHDRFNSSGDVRLSLANGWSLLLILSLWLWMRLTIGKMCNYTHPPITQLHNTHIPQLHNYTIHISRTQFSPQVLSAGSLRACPDDYTYFNVHFAMYNIKETDYRALERIEESVLQQILSNQKRCSRHLEGSTKVIVNLSCCVL